LTLHRYVGTGTSARTYFLKTLGTGDVYTDSVNGITFTQTGVTDNQISFNVQLPSVICTAAMPSLTISPASQQTAPGTSLVYVANVTNTDWSTCPASDYTLSSALPTGWTGTLNPTSLTLGPGTASDVTLTVTPTATATAGTYGLTLTAALASNPAIATSIGATSVVVSPCIRAAPTLTLSPLSQSGANGATLSYQLALTNQDSNQCGLSTFALSQSLASGWTGSLSPASLALSPGQTATATLAVTSPTTSAAGTYAITAKAADTAVAVHQASGTANYLLTTAADTQPPSAPTGLMATIKRGQVKLVWSAARDNVGVTGYNLWRNNTLIRSLTSTSYTDSPTSLGTYSYYVVARDAAGNLSPPSNAVTATVK